MKLNQLGFGKPLERARLVRKSPKAVAEALARLDQAIAKSKLSGRIVRNPAALLRTFLDELLRHGVDGLVSDLARSMRAPYPEDLSAQKAEIIRQARQRLSADR